MEIVSGNLLAKAITDASKNSRRVWIASPYIGRDAHNVFHNSFAWAKDKRVLTDIRSGYVDKVELQHLSTWSGSALRTLRALHAKLYIFDDVSIVTSANLSLNAFERNYEAAVILRGPTAKSAKNLFSNLFAKGRQVTTAEINAHSNPENHGDPSGNGKPKQRNIEIWDTDEANVVEAEVEVGPTINPTGYVSDAFANKTLKVLKAEGLSNVPWIGRYDDGVKILRKKFPSGAVFDLADSIGSKSETWTIGNSRRIVLVKGVFRIDSRSVIAYRTSTVYRVDAKLLAAAKRLHVFSGTPKSHEMLEYRNIVKARKAKG